jgi:hypothetical protein
MKTLSASPLEIDAAANPSANRRLLLFLASALLMVFGSYIFLSYWEYSRSYHLYPHEWSDLLAGNGPAPFQYRLGVLFPADALGRLFPHYLPMRYTITLMDSVFLMAALPLLFLLIQSRVSWAALGPSRRVASLAIALFLLVFYLLWTLWYHRAETIAIFFCLVASSALVARHPRLPAAVTIALLILVAAYGATVRADTIFSFHVGVLLACLLPQARELPLGRAVQAGVSLLSVVAIVALEYYIKNVLYPHATFITPLFQLLNNMRPGNLFMVLFALAPYGATLWLAQRQWRSVSAWEKALTLGSLVNFAFYIVVGRSNEVRIFLPFAMTMLVLSGPLLTSHLAEEQNEI